MGPGMARFTFEVLTWDCPVMFGAEDEYMVVATTMETFDLVVDPVEDRLLRRTHRARSI